MKKTLSAVISVLVLVAVIIGVFIWSNAAVSFAKARQSAPTLSPALQQIAALEADLQDVDDPQARASLEAKLDVLRQGEAERAAAQAQAKNLPGEACENAPAPQPTATRPVGIVSGPEILLPGDFVTSSVWQGEVQGQWTVVYAAAPLDAPEQGLLLVTVENTADNSRYQPPVSGALTITEAQGERLALQSAAGETLYFDIAARQFVDGWDTIVTPLAPLPTFTPLPDPCGG